MPKRILVGNRKGGCGKTTVVCHLAWRAEELGTTTLVVDTDPQADAFRRLTGVDEPKADTPVVPEGARHHTVVWSPTYGAHMPAEGRFDLVVIDVPPKATLGVAVDLVVIPVDGVDAARNAQDLVRAAGESRIPVEILLNRAGGAGTGFDRDVRGIVDKFPSHVSVARYPVPETGAVKRHEDTGTPAWQDQWVSAPVAQGVKSWCRDAISRAGVDLRRAKA